MHYLLSAQFLSSKITPPYYTTAIPLHYTTFLICLKCLFDRPIVRWWWGGGGGGCHPFPLLSTTLHTKLFSIQPALAAIHRERKENLQTTGNILNTGKFFIYSYIDIFIYFYIKRQCQEILVYPTTVSIVKLFCKELSLSQR